MALQGIRNAGRSWLGKIVVGILFAFLILSFAIWGINDIFRGSPQTNVATVGDARITADQFRNVYQAEIQQLMRQTRQSITPQQARALGLDTQILSRLVSEALLDQRAQELGLSASDQVVARSIMSDPRFQGANGQFDRLAFEYYLRDRGLNEPAFVAQQRGMVVRQHLAEAIVGAVPAPLAAREAVHRYASERRSAAYLVLPPTAVGEIPAPTEEQLRAFFDERRGAFRAPEYRAVNVLAVDPEAIAQPQAVSEAEARQRYEQLREARFGTPERRSIQQIAFPSPEEAQAAHERIRAGTSFEALAAERNVPPQDLELGTFARAEMVDPAVGDAAFALQAGEVSAPVRGRFGTVLLLVTAVEPASVRPFEQVEQEMRREIALDRARREINEVHDRVEDLRAGARPLAEIAREKNLPLVQIPAVDRTGRDRAGQPVQAPEGQALIAAAFASDIGVDNEALRTRGGGYVWYDVVNIEPARERGFDEVREEVATQWRAEETSRRLQEAAQAIVQRLNHGEAIETVAAERGLQVQTATDLRRRNAQGPLTADAVDRIFSVPVGEAASATVADGARAVFKVTGATVPPFVTTTMEAGSIEEQLRTLIADDLLGQYIAHLRAQRPVSVNEQVLRRAVGGEV